MAKYVLEALVARFGDAVVRTETDRGDDVAVVTAAKLVEIATWLRDDPKMSFDSPVFVTCIDRYEWQPVGGGKAWDEADPRFEVCFQLRSLTHRHRLRIKVLVSEAAPTVPSLTPVWAGFDWQERETFDMYGIKFAGHPDLRRIYLYDEFVGHPLRKDYPKEKRQPLVRRSDMPKA